MRDDAENNIFRKSISSALFLHLALVEVKERDELKTLYFGPRKQDGKKVSLKDSVKQYMERVVELMSNEVYSHEECTDACKVRGCGRLYVADGCWKLHYPICMYTYKPAAKGLDEYVPHVCTKSPMSGKAFCGEHCKLMENLGIPTGLQPFIKSCGANPANYSKEEKKKVEQRLKQLCVQAGSKLSVPDIQGTRSLYESAEIQVESKYF